MVHEVTITLGADRLIYQVCDCSIEHDHKQEER